MVEYLFHEVTKVIELCGWSNFFRVIFKERIFIICYLSEIKI